MRRGGVLLRLLNIIRGTLNISIAEVCFEMGANANTDCSCIQTLHLLLPRAQS